MTTSTNPDPQRTTGLEPGGSVQPGEASPAEGSMSGAGPQETYNPFKGWARAPLTLILVLVVLVAAFFLAYALVLLL
ncbi:MULTISPECIES: DUF6480 family protein [unclassified Streptomyces]|uniref:DUF6480 family protein n=1 Tax=unclassified Streptomyces TaxID=2593676 RepID=UPI002DDB757F|nr:DUF6480 family protein [Streptomyces sp. NBC_01445]WSE10032.1 DUF6480 family protein [Streptomyces sp. NBC_01445]